MVDLKLPSEVKEVLRQKDQLLKDALAKAIKAKSEAEKEIEDINLKLTGIESLIQEPVAEVTNKELFEVSVTSEASENVAKLSLPQAALVILKNRRKPMTAIQIVQALRKAGRPMNSPNSRDMVTGAVKSLRDQVGIRKEGTTNFYSAK